MRRRLFEIVEIGDVDDKLSIVYDRIMLITIFISIIPLFFKKSNNVFYMIDVITVIIFIFDYILRWLTADIKLKKSKIISFVCYPFTFFAIVDLLSILPVLTSLSAGFKLFRLLRLGKAFKALKVLRYSKSFNIIINVITRERQALLAVCYFAAGYVLVSALVMFSAEPDSFNTFFDAFYWAVVTLTTVGYGDIYPISNVGRVISMLSSVMGIAIVAMPTGIITAGFMNELNNTQEK